VLRLGSNELRGFALIAMSELPLKQHLYGSSDTGRSVELVDPILNGIMLETGKNLNLQERVVNGTTIAGPLDTEGHIGVVCQGDLC
jgi:hypothetical protein